MTERGSIRTFKIQAAGNPEMHTNRSAFTLTFMFLVSLPAMAAEQGEQDNKTKSTDMSIDEVALNLSHPGTSLFSIDNRFKFRSYQGSLPEASDQSGFRYELEGIWPIHLNNGKNVLLRATVPINADQPLYKVGKEYLSEWMIRQWADVIPQDSFFSPGHDHLDDITLNLGYSGVSDSGLISLFGLKAVFPTSQDFSSGRDQYLLGPEIALGKVTSWGVIGATASHVADIGGESGYHTNMTELDVFFAYGLGNGWQIVSNPKIEYDWEAASGNSLFIPLGGGASKTVRWGSVPIKMDAELYYYVESPDAFGPQWMFTFSLAPVLFNK